MTQSTPEFLMRSRHLQYFQHHGQVFAYHNMFGYLIGMSADLAELLEFHNGQLRSRDEIDAEFGHQFNAEQLDEFLTIFRLFSCLLDSELAEERSLWSMVPVRTRWVVYHQPSNHELTFWRTDRSGESHRESVPSWAAKLWSAADGETTLETLYAAISDDASLQSIQDPKQHVLETLTSWVHWERQYLKFAKAPLSKFGPEHQWPSYLRSTMPYKPWEPGSEPLSPNPLDEVATPINPPHDYYEQDVHDADKQFQEVETTLSHLFRHPSSLLNGKTYAQQITTKLIDKGHIGSNTKQVLEVGGGLGHFAAGVLVHLRDNHPELFSQLHYTILDLSPTLRAAQLALLQDCGVDHKVQWLAGNAEHLDLEAESIDLLLCNEVIGDLTTVKLTRTLLGLDSQMDISHAAEQWSEDTVQKLGSAGELIRTYTLPLRDAPDEFYFNVGALHFIEKVNAALRPGGSAFISEYGELTAYPVASTQLDHIEFSIHFGLLAHLSKQLGLVTQFEYIQDLIELDRNESTLETTRTYFASLRALLNDFGIHLDKRAYSRSMVHELLGEQLPVGSIGDIRFRKSDERCMGLSPHEFKALLLMKPQTEN